MILRIFTSFRLPIYLDWLANYMYAPKAGDSVDPETLVDLGQALFLHNIKHLDDGCRCVLAER